jgi:hypothetical protein
MADRDVLSSGVLKNSSKVIGIAREMGNPDLASFIEDSMNTLTGKEVAGPVSAATFSQKEAMFKTFNQMIQGAKTTEDLNNLKVLLERGKVGFKEALDVEESYKDIAMSNKADFLKEINGVFDGALDNIKYRSFEERLSGLGYSAERGKAFMDVLRKTQVTPLGKKILSSPSFERNIIPALLTVGDDWKNVATAIGVAIPKGTISAAEWIRDLLVSRESVEKLADYLEKTERSSVSPGPVFG